MRALGYSQKNNIPAVLREQTKRYGKVPLMIDAVTHRVYTFGEYDSITNSIASYLMAAGARKPEKVCVLMEDGPSYVMVTHGIQKTGAAAVLINTGLIEAEIKKLLDDSKPKIAVTDRKYGKKLTKPSCKILFWEDMRIDDKKKRPLHFECETR
jgi:acyl-coenzyme A synthetase/AMP-(fatty) acid ligase